MKLTPCLSDIREWMCSSLLNLKQDKTELMMFAPKHRAKELTDLSISFGGNIIHDTPYVKNLGAYVDRTLSMEKQCNVIDRSCYFHIRNIGRIRPFISEDACKIIVNALVTSRMDYGNALLYGIAKYLTDKFQRVHNCTTHNKDKEDRSFHTRTDPLTLVSSRISKSVQTYPLCIQDYSWFGSSIFD